MICVQCEEKMKCRFTQGIGRQLRYRSWFCKRCGVWLDTVEVPEWMLREDLLQSIRAKLGEAKRQRFGLLKRLRGGK